MPSMYDDPEAIWRWIESVHFDLGCWEWLGSALGGVAGNRYGGLFWRGQRTYAHRFAFEYSHNRALQPSEHVCHTCDNPKCVRPSHLFVGTHRDNMRDAYIKGRMWGPEFRERHHQALVLAHARPEEKARKGAATKARYKDPRERKVQGERSRRRWDDAEYAERCSASIRTTWQDPNLRAAAGERSRQRWSDPEYRARVSAKISATRKNHNNN